ncbi:hypothetical protein [Ureibacillus thermosphaericus]|uniref:Cytoskeletal protein CcmA (Bactofilin family) n=1 Tax=Ureibacillus thermosphaericus TaxID=51173 RepID=A0A840PPD1_URETH|nr:hypothetical protein [Ureibacillus thermosphaericus]MBB5147780.1 cytoskeletal protein CcmA (bactofilin family) [Ureibacillus thermosphaericus]NKZ30418.1 hypothetical protein [Ureibacillus thermosphaericus]
MLKKYINNSQGYTLFLTFAIIILFSVIAFSLVTLSMNGTVRNTTREESVQSLNLAEKGLDYIVNDINTSLADFTKSGKSKDDFIDELEKYDKNHPKYRCTFDSNGNLISGLVVTTSKASDQSIACIKDVHPVYDEDGELNVLKRKLEIVSIGNVNGKRKQLTTFVEIGADKVPEQLKYALTSQGNIHLNGAVQITGDLRFNGSLTTYEKAHIINNSSHYWVESLKPSMKSTSKRSSPKIVVGNNSKFYQVVDKLTNSQRYDGIHLLNNSVLSNIEKDKISDLFDTSVFDTAPSIITTDSEIKPVDIESKKSAYKYERNSPNTTDLQSISDSYNISSGTYKGNRYLVYTETYLDWCGLFLCTKTRYYEPNNTKTFELNGNFEFDRLATNANLRIKGGDKTSTKVNINDTLYVNGDLTITGKVELQGSIFVNGKLIINNSDLSANALIYVNGQSGVDIQYSKINSLTYKNDNGENSNGTLVIFSKGKVKLANNSLWSDHDNPSEIYGYLYSDQELEIYGVGSNMKIHGGIYGNRITLHAIRGKSSESSFSNSKKYGSDYFLISEKQDDYDTYNSYQYPNDSRCSYPNKNNQQKCYKYHSRLQVHYNEDVVATYLQLNRTEELIYNVDIPRYIDKQM